MTEPHEGQCTRCGRPLNSSAVCSCNTYITPEDKYEVFDRRLLDACDVCENCERLESERDAALARVRELEAVLRAIIETTGLPVLAAHNRMRDMSRAALAKVKTP